MKIKSILLIASFLCVCCSKDEQRSFDLVIENAKVIDLRTGQIEQQTIFINNDQIVHVSTNQDTTSYKATSRINATGKYVMPGLWDNHIHFRGGDSLIDANKKFLKLFLMNGITTVRDAGGDLGHIVLQWKEQIKTGDLLGPNIYTAGPKIDGTKATWAGSMEVASEADVDDALDSLQLMNVDFVKLYDSTISGDLYLKVIQEASKRGLITSGHMPFSVELEATVEAGIDAIEHLYYVLKGCSVSEEEITQAIKNGDYGFWASMEKLIDTYSDSTAQKTFDLLKSKEVYVVPTLHIGDVLSTLKTTDHQKDLYLSLMQEELITTYQGRIDRALKASDEATESRLALNQFFRELAKSLNEAGVKLLAGSDSGAFNSYTYPGESLHKELEALVDAGISPLQALRSSAYHGAQFLDQETQLGAIAKGKQSDIVILNANPLEDIRNTRRIFRVIKGGLIIDPRQIAREIGCLDCIIED